MLKSDFEKRHGRIWYRDAIVAGYITELTKKYDLENLDQPAAVWHVVQNMPDSHFSHLDLGAIQIIFKYVDDIKPKQLRNYYLGTLDHRFFSHGWGWFSRGGRGLSTSERSVSEIPEDEKKTAVRVLKCLKLGFSKCGYHAIYGKKSVIDSYIKEYGGKIGDNTASLKLAKAKIEQSDKLPRKLKKRVKQGWLSKLSNSLQRQ